MRIHVLHVFSKLLGTDARGQHMLSDCYGRQTNCKNNVKINAFLNTFNDILGYISTLEHIQNIGRWNMFNWTVTFKV